MYKIAVVIACLWQGGCFAVDLVDPTKPSVYRQVTEEVAGEAGVVPSEITWVLHSILISPQRKVAVINGKQVSEGETVDQYHVKKIDTYQVVLAGDTLEIEEKVLTLGAHRLDKQYRKSESGTKK